MLWTYIIDLLMLVIEINLFTMPQIYKGLIEMIKEMFRKLLEKHKTIS